MLISFSYQTHPLKSLSYIDDGPRRQAIRGVSSKGKAIEAVGAQSLHQPTINRASPRTQTRHRNMSHYQRSVPTTVRRSVPPDMIQSRGLSLRLGGHCSTSFVASRNGLGRYARNVT